MTTFDRAARSGLLLAGLAVGACRSPEGAGTAERARGLSHSFQVLETRQGSRASFEPRSQRVDYASVLTIRPDREALRKAVGAAGDVDPALRPADVAAAEARIQELQQRLAIVQELRPIVAEILDYERLAAGFYDSLVEGTILQDDARFRDVVERRGRVIAALDRLAVLYVVELLHEGRVDLETVLDEASAGAAAVLEQNQALAEFEAAYGKMAPDPAGDWNRYDAEEVSKLLNEVTGILRGRLEELERATLAKAPKATLEIEAAIVRGSAELPITISPYTTVEGSGRGKKSPRVGLPSQADFERVQREYDAYGELAESLNELQDIARDPAKLKALRETFLGAVETAAEDLGRRLADDLEAVARLEGTPLAELSGAARGLDTELRAIVKQARALGALAKGTDPVTFARRTAAVLESLGDRALHGRIEAFIELLGQLPDGIEPTTRALLERTQTSFSAAWSEFVAALEGAPGTAPLAKLYSSLKSLAELSNAQSFAKIDASKIHRKPFAIDAAEDGTISLADTSAESGDRIAVRYHAVSNPEAAAADRIEYRGSTWIDVRKFGLYSTFKSQLLFVERSNDGQSIFRAAPGIAYNFHYRPEEAQAFFDAVSPGLGVSVSAPSFENGAELAVGLQITLFDDMFQVGWAYNLSVPSEEEIFYFGLDLIGAFQRFR